MQKELELKIARISLPEEHPEITMMKAELATVEQMLDSIFYQGDDGIFLALQKLPESSLRYLGLKRSLEIANQKLVFMLTQFEQARLEEVDETEVLKVIDPAVVPEKRIKPKRTLMVLVSGFIAFCVASLLVVFLGKLERDNAFSEQWKKLGSTLFGH